MISVLDAILCDHAEAAGGKLFINGGGITGSIVQPEPPHAVTLALGIVIQVPYTDTNMPHTLTIRLIDEDGHPVAPWAPDGAVAVQHIQAALPFNVGRPPQLPHGDSQPVALGMNFVGLPLPNIGQYTFVLEVDSAELRRLPFRVNAMPPGMFQVMPQAG